MTASRCRFPSTHATQTNVSAHANSPPHSALNARMCLSASATCAAVAAAACASYTITNRCCEANTTAEKLVCRIIAQRAQRRRRRLQRAAQRNTTKHNQQQQLDTITTTARTRAHSIRALYRPTDRPSTDRPANTRARSQTTEANRAHRAEHPYTTHTNTQHHIFRHRASSAYYSRTNARSRRPHKYRRLWPQQLIPPLVVLWSVRRLSRSLQTLIKYIYFAQIPTDRRKSNIYYIWIYRTSSQPREKKPHHSTTPSCQSTDARARVSAFVNTPHS